MTGLNETTEMRRMDEREQKELASCEVAVFWGTCRRILALGQKNGGPFTRCNHISGNMKVKQVQSQEGAD
jgi:hypothetical protein